MKLILINKVERQLTVWSDNTEKYWNYIFKRLRILIIKRIEKHMITLQWYRLFEINNIIFLKIYQFSIEFLLIRVENQQVPLNVYHEKNY